MLKRIRTDQFRAGMFLHELCGSWMDHPFWRARFVVTAADDLRRLRECGIAEVWIDTARGVDVEGGLSAAQVGQQVEQELEGLAIAAVPPTPAPRSTPSPTPPPPPAPHDVYGQARQLCDRAKAEVQQLFGAARMGQAIQAEGCLPLVDDIIGSVARNPGALMSLARLKTQDEYTYLHSVAVCTLMVALARTLGLGETETREAGLAGLLHDMGKARIPLAVLNKPGRLTEAEFDLVKQHPGWGHALLQASSGVPAMALDVCLHHHEKVDGSGYPEGLGAAQLSLHARMGAVCDVYDAITSSRPYKSAWDPGEAVRQMAQWKGHFDPAIFHAFVKTVGIYPVGTLVRLQSQRLAVVLAQNGASLLTPRVRVFYAIDARKVLAPTVLDLAAPEAGDRITAVEAPQDWPFKNLDALWQADASAPAAAHC